MENYTLGDIRSAVGSDGFGGTSAWVILLLFFLIGGNGWNRNGDYGQFATAASQQDILFGQKFSDLDNKIDRGFTSIGNGISSATFSLNNSIKDGDAMVAGRVVDEGRAMQKQLSDCCCTTKEQIAQVRYDMANFNNAQLTAIHAEGEATRNMIQQNKIDALQSRVNNLEMQNAMCGVVKYPTSTTYTSGGNPFCGCSCSNI